MEAAVRPRPPCPAGRGEGLRLAAESSFAGAERTARGRAPSLPTIRQHTPEAPPRRAGKRAESHGNLCRLGNALGGMIKQVFTLPHTLSLVRMYMCVCELLCVRVQECVCESGVTWFEEVRLLPVFGVMVDRPHVHQNTRPAFDRVTPDTTGERE